MPKRKVKSSASKRFFITGTGIIRRRKAYKSHLLTKKAKKRKRNLRQYDVVDRADLKNVKYLLALK